MDQLASADWTRESLQGVMGAPQRGSGDFKIWKTKMKLIRLGLAGGLDGPALVDTMCVLGKERTLKRLLRVIDWISRVSNPLSPLDDIS